MCFGGLEGKGRSWFWSVGATRVGMGVQEVEVAWVGEFAAWQSLGVPVEKAACRANVERWRGATVGQRGEVWAVSGS